MVTSAAIDGDPYADAFAALTGAHPPDDLDRLDAEGVRP
jgi:hypothetical protein